MTTRQPHEERSPVGPFACPTWTVNGQCVCAGGIDCLVHLPGAQACAAVWSDIPQLGAASFACRCPGSAGRRSGQLRLHRVGGLHVQCVCMRWMPFPGSNLAPNRHADRGIRNLQLEGAIPQIVLMGLSDSDVVVGQACRLIGMF